MVGEEIRMRRMRMGITQRELARLINVKPNTMCQYENGDHKMPLDVLGNIAKILKCSPEDLAFEEFGLPVSLEAKENMLDQQNGKIDSNNMYFADPLDNEIVALLKDLDKIAKEKIVSYMRDQRLISRYYKTLRS